MKSNQVNILIVPVSEIASSFLELGSVAMETPAVTIILLLIFHR